MHRAEFESLAHIGKTTFFGLLRDPAVQAELDYALDAAGRAHVNRRKALEFIRGLRKGDDDRRRRRANHLGVYSTPDAPARGRPCPQCHRRIARKATVCRHCQSLLDVVSQRR